MSCLACFIIYTSCYCRTKLDQTVARLVLSNKLHSIEPDVGYSCHTTRERSEQQHNQNLYFWALLAFYHNPSRFRAECIHYLHNPIIHLYYPPKLLHNHCLQFLLGHENVPREVENNAYADFWGIKEMYYGIRASCEIDHKRVWLVRLMTMEMSR